MTMKLEKSFAEELKKRSLAEQNLPKKTGFVLNVWHLYAGFLILMFGIGGLGLALCYYPFTRTNFINKPSELAKPEISPKIQKTLVKNGIGGT